ncbi:hypothetical protein ACET3Z_019899 [Daucus carota]
MADLTLGLVSLGLVDLEVFIKSGRPQDRKHDEHRCFTASKKMVDGFVTEALYNGGAVVLRPSLLRRLKSDVEKGLPRRMETILKVEVGDPLTAEEQEKKEQLFEEVIQESLCGLLERMENKIDENESIGVRKSSQPETPIERRKDFEYSPSQERYNEKYHRTSRSTSRERDRERSRSQSIIHDVPFLHTHHRDAAYDTERKRTLERHNDQRRQRSDDKEYRDRVRKNENEPIQSYETDHLERSTQKLHRPGINLSVPGFGQFDDVSTDIKCGKGDRTRYQSHILDFNQMSEFMNQKCSVPGKIPSSWFNSMFGFETSPSNQTPLKMSDRLTRIAIVSSDRCKPKKCRQECKKSCPVVKTGKLCIEVTSAAKIAFISEELCIGCGICVKKCPFEAIQIINLPKDLDKDTTHRYGPNTFKLHRLPVPRPGQVLGLVGTNGIGKSTALKVLAGKLKPNLGRFNNPPDWQEILTYFRGSELQNYFTRILEDNLKAIIKPQYVDHIPKAVQGNVGQVLEQKDERDMKEELCIDLELNQVIDRNVGDLSGGELQRFAIAVVAIQNAEIYMFDEPSSYLDVKQRLKAAQVIRSLLRPNSYVIVVEHDLSVLDYLSDFICCLYGKPGAYGVVTLPFSVREGINIFLAGFVPTENLRFREESLTFKVSETPQESAEEIETYARYKYPTMSKTQGGFKLKVTEGEFTDSQIIVMLGENGTGKTTFIRMLAGLLKPDTVEGSDIEIPEFNVSYKPQKISPKFQHSVRHLLHSKIRESYMHPQFVSDVMKPLLIEQLMDQEVVNLSGGELQRVALCLCLGKPADIYLIDEPSAYLDSEQRIVASKVIKRFILHAKKTAFVVEHDFIMATYLADRVIVYEGQPSIDCVANSPQSLLTGMNLFLSQLDITFRRDPTNFRPRINKLNSAKDREQKNAGSYYYLDD